MGVRNALLERDATLMQRNVKIALLSLVLLASPVSLTFGQNKKPDPEMAKLHDDYIRATADYKASLAKLLALYEASARRAAERVAQSKQLFADGQTSPRDVEQSERALSDAQAKVDEVHKQIEGADRQIAQTLIEIEGAYKQARDEETQRRKRAISRRIRPPAPCREWMLKTEQTKNLGGRATYKVVCGTHAP